VCRVFDGDAFRDRDGVSCRSLRKPTAGIWPCGTLSPRPPGIYRLMLAPARRDKASRQAVAGPPDPNLAVRKPPDRRSGRIPALPYPPLEHLQISRASSPIKWPRPKSTFARTSPFANYKLSPFADTAVSFCSHRDREYCKLINAPFRDGPRMTGFHGWRGVSGA
jgi:hypothetical protein